MNIESAVVKVMKRAVDLDDKTRYTEALVYYKEGLQVLDKMRDESDENNKKYLRDKSEEYLKRMDNIKELVQKMKDEGKYREQVRIEKDSTGHGYKTLFGRFLDEEVEYVIIEDPYIRSFCQCQNLLSLCELIMKSCDKLSHIQLRTSKDAKSETNQKDWFYNLKTDLQKYGIRFTVLYYTKPFYNQIVLSSGWIIKIGRGLDIYKAPSNKFCLGVYDLDLRQCHETTVDIVHSTDVKQPLKPKCPNKPSVSALGDEEEFELQNGPNFWSSKKVTLSNARRRIRERAMEEATREEQGTYQRLQYILDRGTGGQAASK